MNSDASPKNQLQSLVSTSSTPTDPSGAGSTIPNTQSSSDSTTSFPTSAPGPTSNGSTISTEALLNPNTTAEDASGDNGPNKVATRDKGQEFEEVREQQPLESIKEEEEATLAPVNQQIELLEHTPETVGDDGQDWVPDGDHEMKRVKVSKRSFFCCVPMI